MSIPLIPNVTISMSGKRLTIVKVDFKRDKAYLHDQFKDEFKSMSYRELRALVSNGDAEVEQKCLPGHLIDTPRTSRDLDEFYFRSAIVERVEKYLSQGMSVSEAIDKTRATDVEIATGKTLPVCSRRSINRHRAKEKIDRELLYSNHKGKGNRTPRYPERVKEITLQLIKDLYAVEHSRFPIRRLTDAINRTIQLEKVLPANQSVSTKYVRSVHKNDWHPDLDHKRLDPKKSKSQKAVAKNPIRPGAPLHRVEIDTVHLPFLVRDEHGIVDNLHLMVALDCETSMPLSWWLMRGKPTTDDTFSCLERALYSKAELLKKFGIKFDVDPYGGILHLYMDNGSENARPRLARVAICGTSPHWTEPHSGHRKPFVERFHRSLKETLETLPGCTRFNGKDGVRTDLAAKNDPLMSFNELEHWIARFLFESWPDQKLDRFITADYDIDLQLGDTPAKRWRHYEETMPIPSSPRRIDWFRTRFVPADGTLSAKTGLTWDTFKFKGENLLTLINQYGPSAKVKFYYNPFDYRFVFVPDKKTGEWLNLFNDKTNAKSAAYSFDQAKARIKAAKAMSEQSPAARAFQNDLLDKSLEKSTPKQHKQERKDFARQRNEDAAAQARAEQHPISPETNTYDDDTFISDDCIQTFKTHRKGK